MRPKFVPLYTSDFKRIVSLMMVLLFSFFRPDILQMLFILLLVVIL